MRVSDRQQNDTCVADVAGAFFTFSVALLTLGSPTWSAFLSSRNFSALRSISSSRSRTSWRASSSRSARFAFAAAMAAAMAASAAASAFSFVFSSEAVQTML